ncbi:syntaxin-11a [Chiloscyllium plagiosum]|uniref:syntaxin-11a n=1 Tax=Chiloscyllium plagiosum TaxID=36176 RepID=UPI001CB80D9A|nr:syntaxin-11a [Chiloscyllium plagiosum]XP_043560186.1 syntaxin-11a [Chiloscyllium plagiosum]XP_043560187.1 syntaxin-11a [Chiloscyllium plagiosum]XP_043560188.1 syntaxin-11a [Chiloscyllium plagiosum]XP_043560189.1 syntaxin-11a [Chiloscyllium plagiosum]
MKDRLEELIECSKLSQQQAETEDEVDSTREGLVFECDFILQVLHKEVQQIQEENGRLKVDIKRLGKQNTRFLTSMRRLSSIKRDSNSIAKDIKSRGEKIHRRLQDLNNYIKEITNTHGPNAAIVRIAQAQHFVVLHTFHNAMSEYNKEEMRQRENCKTRIQRQLEIMGKDISNNEMEEMIEQGKWDVFSGNLLSEVRGARTALSEIEQRHRELLELECRVREIHDLFLQMAVLVEEQSETLNNIEINVQKVQDYMGEAKVQLKKAVEHKRNNICRKIFCCCCL